MEIACRYSDNRSCVRGLCTTTMFRATMGRALCFNGSSPSPEIEIKSCAHFNFNSKAGLSSCVHYAKNGEAIERLGERTRLELDEFCTSDRVARGKLNCSSSNIYKYTWERLEIEIFINTVILVLEI